MALLFLSVLGNRNLFSVAFHLWYIVALLLSFQATLLLSNIVNLGFCNSITDLFIHRVTFLLIAGRALLFILGVAALVGNISALLFRNTFYLGDLDCMTLPLILGGCIWPLDSLALLPGFIPTLLLPNSVTAGNTSQG